MLETHVLQKQSKLDSSVYKYVNTNNFLSSAAIVECLWSKIDALVPQCYEGMSPMLIEVILFLKEKRDMWSIWLKSVRCFVESRVMKSTLVLKGEALIAVEAFVENISVGLASINYYKN